MESPVVDESGTGPKRGPGRPRKWADNAERARAYRERKAKEQAASDELRRERRNLRRRVARLTEALGRAEQVRLTAERRVDQLSDTAAKLRAERNRLRIDLETCRKQAITAATGGSNPIRPAVGNRAARRRAVRDQRRQ